MSSDRPALEHVRAARKQVFNVRVGENMQAFMSEKNDEKDQHAVLWNVMDCSRYLLDGLLIDSPRFLLVEGVFSYLAFVGFI